LVETSKLLIIRLASEPGLEPKRAETLRYLGLDKRNKAVIVSSTPSYMGMLRVVENEVVWASLDEQILALLAKKIHMEPQVVKQAIEEGRIRQLHLRSPKKGYESFRSSRGNIGEGMHELLARMT